MSTNPTDTYTPEEQLEALEWLGAEMRGVKMQVVDADHIDHINRSFANSNTGTAIEHAHEFLRTDPSAWMAMDDVLCEEDGSKLHSDFGYFIYEFRNFKTPHESRKSRSGAAYSVYMQFIREELRRAKKWIRQTP